MTAEQAPVAVFAYRRQEHLRETLASLGRNPEALDTDLTLFLDGSRGESDADDVEATRAFAAQVQGFRSVRCVERPSNIGLSRNVITGVEQMLEESPRVIVLEDDMVVSEDFLRYMNTALDCYEDDSEVVSIHGYVYPSSEPLPEFFFLRGADCWGWATWRRGWATFEPDGAALLRELESRGRTGDFDFGGAFPYTQMLRDQIEGRIDSWAIRWYASAFNAGQLTLYPGTSLVQNIGLDGSGTHSIGGEGLATSVGRMPDFARIVVHEDPEARRIVADSLRAQNAGRASRWTRVRRAIGL